MKLHWRVTVGNPKEREGKNLRFIIRPPYGALGTNGKPLTVKRKTAKTEDWDEAERRAKEIQDSLNAQLAGPNDLTLADVMDRHIVYREHDGKTADSTLTSYGYARRSFEASLGKLKASELTKAEILRARDELERGLAANTINQRVNCVARAWRWAHERGYVSTPWPKIKRLTAKRTKKRPYKEVEVQQILDYLVDYLDGRWLTFFTVLADSGCRVSELCELRGEQVNREGCYLELPADETKGGEPRIFALPPETMALVPEAGHGERVFKPIRAFYRDRALAPRSVLAVLRRVLGKLGNPDADLLDVHSFRRRWISASLRQGTPIPLSMRQTGHKSMKVHLDYQARTVGDDLHAAVNRVRDSRLAARPSPGTSPETSRYRAGRRSKSKYSPPESRVQTSCWSACPTCQETGAQALEVDLPPDLPGLNPAEPEGPPILKLGRSEDGRTLAYIMGLGPAFRRALWHYRHCAALQQGCDDAHQDVWPEDYPGPQEAPRQDRREA